MVAGIISFTFFTGAVMQILTADSNTIAAALADVTSNKKVDNNND